LAQNPNIEGITTLITLILLTITLINPIIIAVQP
jgi:hypothetical protein